MKMFHTLDALPF